MPKKKTQAVENEGEIEETKVNEEVIEVLEDERTHEPIIEETPPVIPDADFIFTSDVAEQWLAKEYLRRRQVYKSMTFLLYEVNSNSLFLLLLAAHSIVPSWTDRKGTVHKGIFNVPVSFNTNIYELEDFIEVSRSEQFITYEHV